MNSCVLHIRLADQGFSGASLGKSLLYVLSRTAIGSARAPDEMIPLAWAIAQKQRLDVDHNYIQALTYSPSHVALSYFIDLVRQGFSSGVLDRMVVVLSQIPELFHAQFNCQIRARLLTDASALTLETDIEVVGDSEVCHLRYPSLSTRLKMPPPAEDVINRAWNIADDIGIPLNYLLRLIQLELDTEIAWWDLLAFAYGEANVLSAAEKVHSSIKDYAK